MPSESDNPIKTHSINIATAITVIALAVLFAVLILSTAIYVWNNLTNACI